MATIYLITVTAFKKNLWIDDNQLDNVIIWLSNHDAITISDAVFESSGLYNQLHIHAIATVPYGFKYSPYTKYGDDTHCIAFKIHWSRIRSKERVISYLKKDTTNAIEQEQLLELNYYHGNFYDCDTNSFVKVSEMKTVTLDRALVSLVSERTSSRA